MGAWGAGGDGARDTVNAGGTGGAEGLEATEGAGVGNGTHRICMHCGGHYKNIQKLGASYKYSHSKLGYPFKMANHVFRGWYPCEVCKKAAREVGYQGPPLTQRR